MSRPYSKEKPSSLNKPRLIDKLNKNSRNIQCIPSDDESEDEQVNFSEEENDNEDDDVEIIQKLIRYNKITQPKIKSTLSTGENGNSDYYSGHNTSKHYKKPIKSPYSQGSLPYRANRSAPSLPYQLEQKKEPNRYSDSSVTQTYTHKTKKEYSVSPTSDDSKKYNSIQDSDDNMVIGKYLKPSHNPEAQKYHSSNQKQQNCQYPKHNNKKHQRHSNKMVTQQESTPNPVPKNNQQSKTANMSGMELLLQREQKKAESKRLKPKLNSSQVKIEGLLGRLPEPGTHKISFQKAQQKNSLAGTPTTANNEKQNKLYSPHNFTNDGFTAPINYQPNYGYNNFPMATGFFDYNNGQQLLPENHNLMYRQEQLHYSTPNQIGAPNIYKRDSSNQNRSQGPKPYNSISLSRPQSKAASSEQKKKNRLTANFSSYH